MAGEISPDIMVCKKKHVRNTPNGCVWVRMGAGRCIDTEGIKNKTKRRSNGRAGHFFNAWSRTERSRNSVMEETGGEKHHGGELWDSKGCFGQQGIRNQCQNSQASNGVKKKSKTRTQIVVNPSP